jgi:CMP/dCMP kinase
VAAAVAKALNALLFDTGAVYRALTLAALKRGVAPENEDELAQLIGEVDIRISNPSKDDGRQYDVILDGEDVTWNVRENDVDSAVSAVSAHRKVRQGLLDLQRRIGASGRVVMPGRDIGSVVMPDAEMKIWLDASLDERSRRRAAELKERGVQAPISRVRTEMQRRDQYDSGRQEAPMTPATDAILIDTEGREIEDVVRQIVQLASLIPSCADRAEGDPS